MKLDCLKIKTADKIIPEFIGLRSTMNCYPIEQGVRTELKKREKGVPGHITNKHQFNLWKQVLNNEIKSFAGFNMIKSKK